MAKVDKAIQHWKTWHKLAKATDKPLDLVFRETIEIIIRLPKELYSDDDEVRIPKLKKEWTKLRKNKTHYNEAKQYFIAAEFAPLFHDGNSDFYLTLEKEYPQIMDRLNECAFG